MSTSQVVAAWTPIIIRGNVYEKTVTWEDENGTPINFIDQQIDVIPNGAASFSWTQGNGKYTLQSTGVYLLRLDPADTTALTWSSGKYRISGIEGDGDTAECFLEGLIFCKDC